MGFGKKQIPVEIPTPVTAAANLAVGFASLGIGSTLEQKLASAGLLEGGKVLYVV